MRHVARLAVYAGIGLFDRVREEIEELVKRGELKNQEGQKLFVAIEESGEDHQTGRIKKWSAQIEGFAKKAVDRLPPVVVHKDLERIEAKIEELDRRIEELRTQEAVH